MIRCVAGVAAAPASGAFSAACAAHVRFVRASSGRAARAATDVPSHGPARPARAPPWAWCPRGPAPTERLTTAPRISKAALPISPLPRPACSWCTRSLPHNVLHRKENIARAGRGRQQTFIKVERQATQRARCLQAVASSRDRDTPGAAGVRTLLLLEAAYRHDSGKVRFRPRAARTHACRWDPLQHAHCSDCSQ